MNSLSYSEIYNKISRKLTSVRWLQKYGLDKKLADNFLKDASFKNGLKEIIETKNFTCIKTLELCKDFMTKLAYPNAPFDWLSYIYQYTLNKSFPEAVNIILLDSLNPSCEIYLRVLRVLSEAEKYSDSENFKSRYPMHFLKAEDEDELEDFDEYSKFLNAYKHSYIYELMKLSEEVFHLTTLDHVCGVHYISIFLGRQLKKLGIPVDLGRVSGASAGHDIGKYGCKGSELKKVPRLHYYYTDQWFKKYGINYIRNIAINHSTWDLELENLSIESLILIYSDFRVKSDSSNSNCMKIYTLDDSFYVILSKLENVDECKLNRYKKVYAKLKDFENFLKSLEIDIMFFSENIPAAANNVNFSLLRGDSIVQNIKYLSIKHNINLMYELRNEYSLDLILEAAKSNKDWKDLREYIRLFEEYSTYLTQRQKLQTINFLYSNLVHPEDDIRRHSAELIGELIAIFDEDYRKEIPENVHIERPSITSSELLHKYIAEMLQPGHKTIDKHKFYLQYNISNMVSSLFSHSTINNIPEYKKILLTYYKPENLKNDSTSIYLLETAKYIPLSSEDEKELILFSYILEALQKQNSIIRIAAIEASLSICSKLSKDSVFSNMLKDYIHNVDITNNSASENMLLFKLSKILGLEKAADNFNEHSMLTQNEVRDIFLSNLKTATDWIKKKLQIDALFEYAVKYPEAYGLHTAIHFCNLLKVSEVESVRNHAGETVLKLMPYISAEEKNELAVELMRALEIEGNKFTEYIPYYAARIFLWLQPNELDEAIDDFVMKVKDSNSNLKSLVLKTIGVTISYYSEYKLRFNENHEKYTLRLTKMLGIILNGLGNYDIHVKQYAFSVIGKQIFASDFLSLKEKAVIFRLTAKKILTLISENINEELLFLTNSAALNSIYRFISEYTFKFGNIDIPGSSKIAFFPGTFDPFSLSHKEIVKSIKAMGFEVYLSVDEFSWSKMTLPGRLRENILNMSLADEFDTYIFPYNIPINIANPHDLKELKNSFPDSHVYIAVGSDVILNASSYKLPKTENSIRTFPHIIFERYKNQKLIDAIKNIDGDVITLTLPNKYSDISSTQIRNYIDDNRDISSLVDPLVQQYIYDNGFYQREPQDKAILKSIWLDINIIDEPTCEILHEVCGIVNSSGTLLKNKLMDITGKPSGKILLMRNRLNDNEIVAFSIFHRVDSGTLYKEIMNLELTKYIRDNSLGRIVILDGFYVNNSEKYKSMEQVIITETLAYCSSKDYDYAIFKPISEVFLQQSMVELLKLSGFVEAPYHKDDSSVPLVVDMSTPCILNLDIENVIKEPFISNTKVKNAIATTRKKLQQALICLYPGKLVLSFDINTLHQFMIKKICEENNVPIELTQDRKLGNAMCVPYGDILDRYIIPNTVTKALHTEKYYYADMTDFKIGEFPHYHDLTNQVRVIKSFGRPIILVDNILHKGYRIKALDPLLKKENIKVQRIIAGVMSGRGKDLMDMQNREVSSVYFIPRLRMWFNESAMYPFIGGDALWRGTYPERNLVPSINPIMPYASPTFIKNTSKDSIYNMSTTCIENSLAILTALEGEFHILNNQNLNLYSLGQVFTTPRCVDHGKGINYNLSLSASYYLKNDLELLKRFSYVFNGG